jgi:ferredoxin
MKKITIPKNQLPRLLDDLIQRYKVYAPVQRDNVTGFDEVTTSTDVYLDSQTKLPSKEVLFPQCETLFTYRSTNGEIQLIEPEAEDDQTILFGVPPCDARSILIIEKAFGSGDFQDPYYLRRKANLLVIGKACEQPRSTCFCTSVGGGPFDTQGSDLLLQDLGEKYLLEALTLHGEELMGELQDYEVATQADEDAAHRNAEKAEASLQSRLEVQGIESKLETMFEDSVWDTVYQNCVGCGACTYLCPTCYCFDIVDEGQNSQSKRVRIWDSCQFPLFTLQGSGENPRHTGKERMRQRIMHKFHYYPKNYSGLACVGCGRCVRECPVNLDIRTILSSIMAK